MPFKICIFFFWQNPSLLVTTNALFLNFFKACLPFVTVPVAGDTQKSSSHFHCLKCDYYCTDTNKVVAHRRQHQKLDSIMAAGFEKFTPTQFCPVGGCPHNGKQTHYHCSKCQYAVLGLSQMEGHKYRHMNEWNAPYYAQKMPLFLRRPSHFFRPPSEKGATLRYDEMK